MDPFDQLWWTLLAWVLMRMIRDQEPQRWLLAGVVIGLGLQTKLTIAFFVLALLAGLLLSASRKLLFNRWLIFGGLIALAIISPYLVWQATQRFPGRRVHGQLLQRQDLPGHRRWSSSCSRC